MRKFVLVAATVLCCTVFSGSAIASDTFPQVYPESGFTVKERDKLGRTGVGMARCEYAFTRDKALADQAVKEISWLKLEPGTTIGVHKHDKNEDVYVIVSGSGLFIDEAGKETPIKGGDVTIARKSEAHGIKNTGKETLVILNVLAQQ